MQQSEARERAENDDAQKLFNNRISYNGARRLTMIIEILPTRE